MKIWISSDIDYKITAFYSIKTLKLYNPLKKTCDLRSGYSILMILVICNN